uniref:Putative photosystem I PsaA/PsaB n=1 Tax=Helianthus annuus TaxID=4232 RepID=A0A1Y3BY02_HELAN
MVHNYHCSHHMWIGGFLMLVLLRMQPFYGRDYDPTTRSTIYYRVLRHRDAIISHLNGLYISRLSRFGLLFIMIHGALGRPQDMFSDTAIQLQPVFAQWIQTHALALVQRSGATASTSLTWGAVI